MYPMNDDGERLQHGQQGGRHAADTFEAEIIVAIPPALARDIMRQRGWLFPLPPAMLDKVKTRRQAT
jgi:hypothetical protein